MPGGVGPGRPWRDGPIDLAGLPNRRGIRQQITPLNLARDLESAYRSQKPDRSRETLGLYLE